jgi:uncharacterized protein (DUF2062 family)
VENKSPCFLGHYAIALTACMMYCPFLMQSVIGAIYLGAVFAILVCEAWRFEKWLPVFVGSTFHLM